MSHQRTQALVESVTPITDSILQLILKPETYIDYQAGQYLQIISGDDLYSYSIANAPLGSHKYELHIRHSRDNTYNQRLLMDIKREGRVMIQAPLGECDVSRLNPHKPIVFIAAGTGFAPIKAMIEQLLAEGAPRAFELYWGARSQSDLYMDEKVAHWQQHVNHFNYVTHLSEASNKTLVSKVIARHPHDLHSCQMVISGPFDMVYTTRDILVAKGVLPTNLFSDAFSYEKK